MDDGGGDQAAEGAGTGARAGGTGLGGEAPVTWSIDTGAARGR